LDVALQHPGDEHPRAHPLADVDAGPVHCPGATPAEGRPAPGPRQPGLVWRGHFPDHPPLCRASLPRTGDLGLFPALRRAGEQPGRHRPLAADEPGPGLAHRHPAGTPDLPHRLAHLGRLRRPPGSTHPAHRRAHVGHQRAQCLLRAILRPFPLLGTHRTHLHRRRHLWGTAPRRLVSRSQPVLPEAGAARCPGRCADVQPGLSPPRRRHAARRIVPPAPGDRASPAARPFRRSDPQRRHRYRPPHNYSPTSPTANASTSSPPSPTPSTSCWMSPA